jgi:hypothetical protein
MLRARNELPHIPGCILAFTHDRLQTFIPGHS